MSDQAILRITREIRQIQQGTDLSLAVACQESDIRNVKALIVGPPGSPYQFGFFEFCIKFPKEYPANPPNVRATTTNGGRCRFNPNIYASGKVCLSILGTWRGERGEQWSSAQGLESILISIQSLMSSNPYENEPGFENAKSSEDKKNMAHYVAKIQHETLRLAVIQPLEESLGIQSDGTVLPPETNSSYSTDEEDETDQYSLEEEKVPFEPFNDLRKRRFLWYYESYMRAIEEAEPKTKVKQHFEKMPFEGTGNSMDGHFNYPELKKRMALIKETITNETIQWAVDGLALKQREAAMAVSLERQYERIVEDLCNKKNFALDLSISNGNPFIWDLTFFGRPMTHLDGGIFKMQICLSPRFPDEQPRVFVETPLFHHRISKDGVLCYFPLRTEEMKHHIEAVMEALEEESPPYDPRTTVNLEASQLFWGPPEDKKKYYRALRRSVERSTE
jgi:ubiquitin-conjugating enzyme E2 Z